MIRRNLSQFLTPHGHLLLAREADAVALDEEVARRLEESFLCAARAMDFCTGRRGGGHSSAHRVFLLAGVCGALCDGALHSPQSLSDGDRPKAAEAVAPPPMRSWSGWP